MTSNNKVRIDAPSGIIEIEGEKDFVESQVDKLLPVLRGGFGSRPTPSETEASTTQRPSTMQTEGEASKPKVKRRVSVTPKGQSCRDRMNMLRAQGFFKSHRSISDIVEGLGKAGYTHNLNQVSAALVTMHARSEIQRTKDGGSFKYYWDRG